MIEAIPLNSECIVLIITKVEDPEELDTRLSKFAPSIHEGDDFDDDNEELADVFSEGADEVLNMLRKMSGSDLSEESSESKSAPAADTGSSQHSGTKKSPVQQISCQLFTFGTLNNVTRLAHVASAVYQGSNTLYKDEKSGSYLLLIDSAGQNASDFNRICNLISE